MSCDFKIPEGWAVKSLSECCDEKISYGIVQPGKHLDHGIPVIRVNNFTQNGLELNDVLKVCPSISQKHSKTILKGGEILLTLVGSTGKSIIVPKSMKGWNVPRAIAVIRLSKDINTEWVKICLQSSQAKHFLDSRANTTVQKTINIQDVKNTPILFPPAEYQKKALQLITGLDQKIQLNHQTNQTLEAMAQALFKSWFVDFDPVKAKMRGESPVGMDAATAALFPDQLVESELGLIPQGWEVTSLYSLGEFINGAAYKKFEPNEKRQGLPIIKIAECKQGVTSKTKFSNVDMPEKYKLKDEDILFSWSGNPDTSIDIFIWANQTAWLNQHIFKVIPKKNVQRSYLILTLKHMLPEFQNLARDKQTTGLGHVTVTDIKKTHIALSSLELRERFVHKANPFIDLSFKLTKQNQTLIQLRDTLLPKLLSGELSLDAAESQLHAALDSQPTEVRA